MRNPDLYSILGLSKNAKSSEIKKAYRTLAMKHHPDKNQGDPKAEAKFKEIQEAYEILSDPKKKSSYDQFGSASFKNGGNSSFNSMNDLFGDLFKNTGFDPFSFSSNQNRSFKGKDLVHKLNIDFLDSIFGKELDLVVPKYEDCSECDGSGATDSSKIENCLSCNGTGQSQTVAGFMKVVSTCVACKGTGTRITEACNSCDGKGMKKVSNTLNINIPAGVDKGMRLRVEGQGEKGINGGPPGDLFIILNVLPHKEFTRDNNNIRTDLELTFTQLVLGSKVKVPTVRGSVELQIPKNSQVGRVLRIKDEGIKGINGQLGDHLVTLKLKTPPKVTPEIEKLLLDLEQLCS